MQTEKMLLRLCGAIAITFLFGLLSTGFRTASAVPSPNVFQSTEECPTANFTYLGSTYGSQTCFTNLSSRADSCSWDFGDGSGSTETNPQHTYGSPGSYLVRLTVYGDGCEASFIGTVDIIGG